MKLKLCWQHKSAVNISSISLQTACVFPDMGHSFSLTFVTTDSVLHFVKNDGKNCSYRSVACCEGEVPTSLLSFPVFKHSEDDVIVGDIAGFVTIYSHDRVLFRTQLSHAIMGLCVEMFQDGLFSVVASDYSGSLEAVYPSLLCPSCSTISGLRMQVNYSKWQLNTASLLPEHDSFTSIADSRVRFMLSVQVPTFGGVLNLI